VGIRNRFSDLADPVALEQAHLITWLVKTIEEEEAKLGEQLTNCLPWPKPPSK